MEMRKSQLKKSKRQNRFLGFTLLECLLALLLLSIICMLFSASIKNAAIVTNHLNNVGEKEWQIFLIQLENELKNCHYERTQPNKIILRNKKNNKPVWIEHKLDKLVKVDNGGYQPLLIGVKQAAFMEQDKTIIIKVAFENNLNVVAKWIITQEHEHD
ncbi:competence protein ComGF [Enterococcus sp. AZ126]